MCGIGCYVIEDIYIHHNTIDNIEWSTGYTVGDSTAIYVSSGTGRNVKVEYNNIYGMKGARGIFFRSAGNGHSISYNSLYIDGNSDVSVTICQGLALSLPASADTENLIVQGNNVIFADATDSDANAIKGINWASTDTATHTGLKIVNNLVHLDDQTKSGGGSQVTRGIVLGSSASQVLKDMVLTGNVVEGTCDDPIYIFTMGTFNGLVDRDNSWNTILQVSTLAVTMLAGERWTNTGAGADRTFTLPLAIPGFEVYVERDNANYAILLDPNGTDYFLGSTAGLYKSLDSDGSYIHVKCYKAGTWHVVASYGVISDE